MFEKLTATERQYEELLQRLGSAELQNDPFSLAVIHGAENGRQMGERRRACLGGFDVRG